MAKAQLTPRGAYAKKYRSTPKGAAIFAWNRLTSRAGGKYGHSACYRTVEVRMAREEFIAWAVPVYEAFFRDHPGVTPSIDRIDPDGHYELSNLRIIPVGQNRRQTRGRVNDFAPTGTRYCACCKQFLPHADFYRTKPYYGNPLGFSVYCRPCTMKKSEPYRQRTKQKKSEYDRERKKLIREGKWHKST